MLGAPWWAIAVRGGFKSYGSLGDYEEGLPFSQIIATGPTVADKPEMVGGLVRGYVKAVAYSKEEEEGTLEAMTRFSSEWGVDDKEIAKMVWDAFSPFWTAEIDVAGVDKLMHTACDKLGKPYVPVDSYVDTRFINAALAPSKS